MYTLTFEPVEGSFCINNVDYSSLSVRCVRFDAKDGYTVIAVVSRKKSAMFAQMALLSGVGCEICGMLGSLGEYAALISLPTDVFRLTKVKYDGK